MKTIIVKTHAEINALVAEKVMGWYVTKSDQGHYYGHIKNMPDVGILPYSTDIAAAWQVVEKMAERFQVPSVGSETSGWVCQIVVHGKGLIMSTQPIAPLAICLCGLASVGVEIDLLLSQPKGKEDTK